MSARFGAPGSGGGLFGASTGGGLFGAPAPLVDVLRSKVCEICKKPAADPEQVFCVCHRSTPDVEQSLAVPFELNQRLFADTNKDVTFLLKGGEKEYAHQVVLRASSEVWARMFANENEMREKCSGVIELSDVSRVEMRVFLRLLYTGHVDSKDWDEGTGSDHEKAKQSPPLEVLVRITNLAKRYMVESILSLSVHALKMRARRAQEETDYATFEKILKDAVDMDLRVLVMACLDLAKRFPVLRDRYTEAALPPELQFELQAIWPSAPKRRTLACLS